MSSLVPSWFLVIAGLLFFLGMLLGTAWTSLAMQSKLRHLANKQRKLNEEWLALRAASNPEEPCPRCGYVVTEQIWYITPTEPDDSDDDD